MTKGQFNPFPGLRPFEPDEDYLFFGREKQIDELLRRLGSTRLLCVIGESGAGKSSLVRCGLIPSLYSGLMSKAGSSWRVAIMRPGNDPMGALAAALDTPGVLGSNGDLQTLNRVLIEATLRRSTRGLIDAVRISRLPAEDNVLLVIDQFEELFRFRRSGAIPNSRDEAALFVKLLLETAQRKEVPVHIVLTMRSDFIGDCTEYLGLPEAVSAGQYLVPRLSRDELRLAITGPVAVARGRIASRLVTRLLNDVGGDPDQLPLLQHALMRTWDEWARDVDSDAEIDVKHYESIGTMRNALSLHAEEAYAEAAAATSPELVSCIFKALTDASSDSRGVRRPASVEQLAQICAVSESQIQAVVEVFRAEGRSFLMPPVSVPLNSRSVIDISHESLMRCWPRLAQWVDQERESAQIYQRISQAGKWFEEGAGGLWRDPELGLGLQWRANNRPTAAWALRYNPEFHRAMEFLQRSERERDLFVAGQERARKRKLRRVWSIAGALAVLSLACGVFAWLALNERDRAERNLRLATDAVDQMLLSAGEESGRVASEIPEVHSFRKDLLSKAQAFYVRFLKQKPSSGNLEREMAVAHLRLGDIHRLDEQNPAEALLAVSEYSAASRMFHALAAAHDNYLADREQEANAQNWLGETYRVLGDQSDAERAYNRALAIQEQLLQLKPQNHIYAEELARTSYNRGIVRALSGNPTAADADWSQAINLLTPLSFLGGSYRQELDRTYNNRAILLSALGRKSEAEALFRTAIASHEILLKASPENRDYQLEFALFCDGLASLYRDSNRFDMAERLWHQSHAQIEQLARPASSLVIVSAKSLLVYGSILKAEGKPENAADVYEQAIQLLARIEPHDSAAGVLAYHLTYGEALDELARQKLSEHAFVAAVPLLTRAIPHNQAARDDRALAWDYTNLATAQLETGFPIAAGNSLEKVKSLLPQIAEPDKTKLSNRERALSERVASLNRALDGRKEERQRQ